MIKQNISYLCLKHLISMKQLKIYIDTSVIGGFFDKEFEIDTKAVVKDLIDHER